jgi:hypothetical protein
MNRSVTRQGTHFLGALGVGLTLGVSLSLSACGGAAADTPKAAAAPAPVASAVPLKEGGSRLQNGSIAYVMTHKFWAVYETPAKDGKTVECPTGMNDGPREQFRMLYGDGKGPKKYTVVEAQLKREGDLWHPSTTPEPPQLKFKEAQGKVSYGMNLDGKIGPNDFESPDGVKGVDNQLYRAIGCIGNYRTMGTIYHFEDLFMNSYNDARIVVELTHVKSLENSADVTVNIYRGSDRMLADSTGEGYLPGGTQHVDLRWGKQFVSHTKGQIVAGVLTTDPIDRAELPWGSTFGTHAYHVFRGLRLQLKLTDGTAKGMLAGYVDTDAFIHHLNTSWSTHHHSYGQLSSQSLYRELVSLADGYPDAKTGRNTAISSAANVEFVQVYLVKPNETKQLTASNK